MNVKQVFETDVTTNDYNRSYAPTIIELTPKQLRHKRVMRRVKYVLKIVNYILLLSVGLTFLYQFLWILVMFMRELTEVISFTPSL